MRHAFPHSRRSKRAISLVIVLASLVFLSALVVAFLVQMSTELRSSKAYAQGVSARILADSATNIVLGEIHDATRDTDDAGDPLTWASQPGAIRTYDIKGEPAQFYKLYSDSEMTGDGMFDVAKAAAGLTDWHKNPAIFTDLNEPLAGKHPILDPAVANDVPGFTLAPGDLATSVNAAPMPVKWLYVLADGSIVAPTGSGTLAKVAGAQESPIVGRIAFWTDDETSKVNINTASEGTYSDTPRASSDVERELMAKMQPVKGEFQRYPGHPATTCLSAVFPALTDKEQIYRILPRVNEGGSRGGTVQTTMGATIAAISPDADRLFVNTDELTFQASRDPSDAAVLAADKVARSEFFLTANSRSPELNLFNKPRVSMWPLHAAEDSSHRSAFDQLIAFCTSLRRDLGGNHHRYYFTRSEPNSSTQDLPQTPSSTDLGRNRMLLEYLRYFTDHKVPGFGGSFRDKYGADTDQILTQIFDYIRATNLRDSNVAVPYTVSQSTWKGGVGQVIPIEDTVTNTRGFGRFRTVQGASLLFIANVDGNVPASQVDSAGNALPAPPDSNSYSLSTQVKPGHTRIQAIFLVQLFDPSVGSVFNYPNFKWQVEGLDQFQWDAGSGYVTMGYPNVIDQTQNAYSEDNAFFGDQFGLRQLADSAFVSARIDVPSTAPFNFKGGDITITLRTPDDTIVQTAVLRFPDGTFPVPLLAPDKVYNYDYNSKLNKWSPGPYNMRYFTYSGPGSEGGRLASKLNAASWILDQDTIRSISANPGDMRLIAARKATPLPDSPGYPYAPNAQYASSTVHVLGAHNFFSGNGEPYYGAALGRLVKSALYDNYAAINKNNALTLDDKEGGLVESTSASDIPLDGIALGKKTAFATGDIRGDFDNGPSTVRDGAYINKPDEGDIGYKDSKNTYRPYNWRGRTGNYPVTSTLFTPNRLIPSPVMLGSLPSGVLGNRPWQTLLFRHDAAGTHPGSKNRKRDGSSSAGMPADHLLLDLFTMPVVEPYAISEPLSTAGKINLNYQIAPFTYINRDTGIRAVLKSEKVISIPDGEARRYKLNYDNSQQVDIRKEVQIDETLKGFKSKFDKNEIFVSATEICEVPIVPSDGTYASLISKTSTNYWNTRRITGDNSRERLYATIYPRVTTKSNTFTIHVRAQTLKKTPRGEPDQWIEGVDQVTGEFRGSQLIERYVDPNDPAIPDFADITGPDFSKPISDLYKFRVVSARQFSP